MRFIFGVLSFLLTFDMFACFSSSRFSSLQFDSPNFVFVLDWIDNGSSFLLLLDPWSVPRDLSASASGSRILGYLFMLGLIVGVRDSKT